jgi:membrane-associated phospholipid phosphatase
MGLIKANSYFFFIYTTFLIIAGGMQVGFSQEEIIFWVNQHNNTFLDTFFKYVTYLGDGIFYLLIALFFIIKHRKQGKLLFFTYILTSLVAQFLKMIVFPDILRPMGVFEHKGLIIHLVEGVQIHIANSFPSGHTTSAFSLALMLCLYLKNNYLGGFLCFLAILVAYSRMYLFQHFCVDVFAGAFLGVVLSVLVILKFNKDVKI